MALYKYGQFLQQENHTAFDGQIPPGTAAANPGIYRCTACGDEIAIAKGHTLPPQNHHQHTYGLGAIRWQLIVCATSRQ